MLRKNSTHTVDIVDYTHDGLGVAKIDNFPIFIPYTLMGEVVEIKIINIKKNIAFGKLTNIIKQSNSRVTPKCSHYYQCGGCNISHMSYEEQLRFKQLITSKNITKIGKIDVLVNDTIASTPNREYRNKVILPVQITNKEVKIGFYKERTNVVIDIKECIIQPSIILDITNFLKELIIKYNITNIRNIMFRVNKDISSILITFILNTTISLNKDLINNLTDKYNNIVSINELYNLTNSNVVLKGEQKNIYNKEYIEDILLDNKYEISSKSFYQINRYQTETLYSKAFSLLDLSNKDTVLDCYCGIGTIGLSIASKVKEVIGIEIVKEAIDNAFINANNNNINNATFICGKVEESYNNINKDIDLIILDPPRKGCDKSVLDFIINKNIPKVLYISCNNSTLARDLNILSNDYNISSIECVDMFPETYHVENICVLSKKCR